MAAPKHTTRGHFSDAARAAAIEARRQKRREAQALDALEVYVVRLPEILLRFGWEIRRFGGVVLHKGAVAYATPDEARSAGRRVLSNISCGRVMPAWTSLDGTDTSVDKPLYHSHVVPLSPQRELMRQLFRTFGDDREAVCQAYAEAERDGKVERTRGREGMAPHIHAGTLWWEGRLRGWLRS